MSIVCSAGTSPRLIKHINVASYTQINHHQPAYSTLKQSLANRLPRHIVRDHQYQYPDQHQSAEQQQYYDKQQDELLASSPSTTIKRSYSTSGNGGSISAAAFNALSGLQHITSNAGNVGHNSYEPTIKDSVFHPQYTEAKPIYEQHSDNSEYGNYGSGGGGSGGGGGGGGSGGGGFDSHALHSAIYNLQTAGTHNSDASNSGSDSSYMHPWSVSKLTASSASSPSTSSGFHKLSSSSFNDKISEGNFLHHYDSSSGYNELSQQPHSYVSSVESHPGSSSGGGVVGDSFTSSSYEHDEHEQDNSNFAASLPASSHSHTDVINYVPYPVVKKLHVPVSEPIKIPVSHAVIIPVSKPVPIHVPVTQTVQVPVEKELKIPVERVIPYPVEKHIPVPVEKKVPYTVVKYMPIKVPHPFPVKFCSMTNPLPEIDHFKPVLRCFYRFLNIF
uniref:Uncharacterized protein n=1 Tax=Glossina brevipalpis TaxID=37001 RepID=A0A1A9W1B9_9MUSC